MTSMVEVKCTMSDCKFQHKDYAGILSSSCTKLSITLIENPKKAQGLIIPGSIRCLDFKKES